MTDKVYYRGEELLIKIRQSLKEARDNYAYLDYASRLSSIEFSKQREKITEVEKQQRPILKVLHDDLLELRTLGVQPSTIQQVEREYGEVLRCHAQVQSVLLGKVRSELADEARLGDQRALDERAQLLADRDAQLGHETEREAALRKLEEDMIELQNIYVQLAAQVGEQAMQVDTLAEHVEASWDEVDAAQKQLQEAKEHRERTRRFWIILGLVIGGVLAILLVVIIVELAR